MNMISGAARRKYLNFIFVCNPAEIAVEPLANFVPDERSPFCGREDDVDQATYVTMRHRIQPSLRDLSMLVYPGLSTQDSRPGTLPFGSRLTMEMRGRIRILIEN